MVLCRVFLLIALMFLHVLFVDSVADMHVVDMNRDEINENTGVLQNDDMKKVLEIVKSMGLKTDKHEKMLSDQEDTINKLKQSVEEQRKKIQGLEAYMKVKNIKIKNLETAVKKIQRKCSLQSFLCRTVIKHCLDEADHKFTAVDERQLPNQSIKGSIRQITRREIRHVSFSAYLSHLVENLGGYQTIKFDQVITNDGNAYNPHTGVFTVPVTGTFVFTFYVASSTADVVFLLRTDGKIQASGVARPANFGQSKDAQGGGTAILRLNQGVSVWLENRYNGGIIFSSDYYRWVTFSGFLLY